MKYVVIAAVLVVPPLVVALLLARSAAIGDLCPTQADLEDVYCPHCDGTDVYDWGEGDWWACHNCRMMFEVKP